MKRNPLHPSMVLAAMLITTLAFTLNLPARADGDREHDCDHETEGQLNAVVVLTATTNAPVGARGVAKIEAAEADDHEAAHLELKLVGLNAGDYLLSVTRQSDGTNVLLGRLAISNSSGHTNWSCRDEDDNEDHDGDHHWTWNHDDHWIRGNWGGFTNWGSWTNWSITNWCNASNRATAVEAELDLPAGLDPLDIGQVQLSDTNGVLILVGDLVKPAASSVINISARGRVVAGPAAPEATGVAQVRSTAVKGKWKHQFNLQTSGLEARIRLGVFANGKKVGAALSNRDGQLQLKKMPPKLPAIRSIELFDRNGHEVARVRF